MENNYRVYHLNTGQNIIGRIDPGDTGDFISYPMLIIQNPQVTPQGGVHVMTLLTPFTMYSDDNSFNIGIFIQNSFLVYSPSQDLIEMYEKTVAGFRARKSGIVVPEMRLT